jgi:ribosomal protein L37AE/L43A
MIHHAEDNIYCTNCHETLRMKRVIGRDQLWKCPQCGILLAHRWGDTMQARSLRENLVKSAEQCEAEDAAAAKTLAARKGNRT